MAAFSVKDFDIHKNYVIEASAGTGKTFSIVQIVKKLVKNGIDLQKILIVTYTDKAAGELKKRIRDVLPGADVDSAPIGTIHSFSKKTIEEFCITSGEPSDLMVITGDETGDFVKRFIRVGKIYQDICGIKKNNPAEDIEDDLVRKMTALLERYYLNSQFREESAIVTLRDDPDEYLLLRGWYIEDKSLLNIFPEVRVALNTLSLSEEKRVRDFADKVKTELQQTGKLVFRKLSAFNCDKDREAHDCLYSYKTKMPDFKKASIVRILATHYLNDLYQQWQEEKAARNAQTYDDMLRNVREAVVSGNLTEKLRARYQYAIIDEFQDTNQKQWDVFREVFLNGEGNHIIVVGDPKQSIYGFQGADKTVYDKAIKEIGGEHRELNTNYRSSAKMIESVNAFFTNTANAANAANTAPLSEPYSGVTVPSDSKLKAYYGGKELDQAFWMAEDPNGSENHVKPEDYAKLVCQTIIDCCTKDPGSGHTRLRVVKKIEEEYKTHDVGFSDFAVLCRTHSEMPLFTHALETYGIPYVLGKDETLFDSQECAHWGALLKAIEAPSFTGRNRALFRKALNTVFFGYSIAETHSPDFDKDNAPGIQEFDRWRTIAGEKRWDALIERILEDTGVEGKLSTPKDIRSLGLIRQIGDYCVDFLSAGNGLRTLINKLSGNAKTDTAESIDGEESVAKSTDSDCVKVMTIHSAKGLEFPVVISGAGHKGKNNKVDVHIFHEINTGNRVLSLSSPPADNKEWEEEQKRLLYVDYTRPKYVLILPDYEEANGVDFISKSIRTYRNDHRDLYRKLTVDPDFTDELMREAVQKILEDAKVQNSGSSLADKTAQGEVLKKLHNEVSWHSSLKHAYSSLSHGGETAETVGPTGVNVNNEDAAADAGLKAYDEKAVQVFCKYDKTQDPVALSDRFPAGADLGNALHDIFEQIDYQKDTPGLDDLIRNCFRSYGLRIRSELKWEDDVKLIIQNVLHAKLPVIHGGQGVPGESFELSDLSFNNRKNEVEFNFNKEGQLLHHYFNGFIDLVFRRGEYYSILDWKSDRLNDEFTAYNDGAILKGRVDELYSIQRVLYSYTLIKWLKQYYPNCSEEEIFNQHFGGVYYVFLRGCNEGTGNGVYAQTWASYQELKAAYDKIVAEKVRG